MEKVYKMIIFLIYINTPKIGFIAPEAVDRRAQGADTGKQSLMPTRQHPWQTAVCRLGWTSHATARSAIRLRSARHALRQDWR